MVSVCIINVRGNHYYDEAEKELNDADFVTPKNKDLKFYTFKSASILTPIQGVNGPGLRDVTMLIFDFSYRSDIIKLFFRRIVL